LNYYVSLASPDKDTAFGGDSSFGAFGADLCGPDLGGRAKK